MDAAHASGRVRRQALLLLKKERVGPGWSAGLGTGFESAKKQWLEPGFKKLTGLRWQLDQELQQGPQGTQAVDEYVGW